MEVFCNIINVFTVTFEQFYAPYVHNTYNGFHKYIKLQKKKV